jgi:hypothetical protein
MAYHGVLIPRAIAAMNVDAYTRSAICAAALDNGNVVKLTTRSTTSNEAEVFTAVVPSNGNGLTGLWMVYSGDEIVLTDSKYKGLDPDVRNFYTAASKVVSVYKPQLGDIIELNAEALYSTYVALSTTHINATDTTGGYKLEWGTSQTGSVLSYKLLSVGYISLATGAIDSQRVTTYVFECVGL